MPLTHQLVLSPTGKLLLHAVESDSAPPASLVGKELADAFEDGSANGLLALAAVRRERHEWSSEWLFWY